MGTATNRGNTTVSTEFQALNFEVHENRETPQTSTAGMEFYIILTTLLQNGRRLVKKEKKLKGKEERRGKGNWCRPRLAIRSFAWSFPMNGEWGEDASFYGRPQNAIAQRNKTAPYPRNWYVKFCAFQTHTLH